MAGFFKKALGAFVEFDDPQEVKGSPTKGPAPVVPKISKRIPTPLSMEDADKFDVILAHQMNGKAIPVKTKGPLFIVYPFDSKPELQTSTYYERSAWQLKSLTIE